MKRLVDRWNGLNLKYKLFTTTSLMLVVLAVLIMCILYLMLPSLYQNNKEYNINLVITEFVKKVDNKSVEYIEKDLCRLTSQNILYVKLENPDGKVIVEKNKFLINMDIYKNVSFPRERINMVRSVKVKGYEKPYRLYVSLVIYPLSDISKSIRELMPIVFLIILIISFFGSYVFSELITGPLVMIINQEKYQITRKKEFIGAISHELKTPITIISGQLEGMMYGVGKFKDRDLYLQKCYETTQELKSLVDQMIEVSKKDIFDTEVDREEIDLNEIIKNTVEKYKFLFEQKNMKVQLNISNRGNIYANQEDITTVISNLISNAIKYSPEGNRIMISTERCKKNNGNPIIKFTIENTGAVLTKKEIEKVFDPLYRVESSRNRDTGGSGLGLYYVSQILNNHGFTYKMFSRENSTVFTIDFISNDI